VLVTPMEQRELEVQQAVSQQPEVQLEVLHLPAA
jgi:hypothetical protein